MLSDALLMLLLMPMLMLMSMRHAFAMLMAMIYAADAKDDADCLRFTRCYALMLMMRAAAMRRFYDADAMRCLFSLCFRAAIAALMARFDAAADAIFAMPMMMACH